MLETFVALLAAHMAADFVLQSNWIIANKHTAKGFSLHAAIVLITSVLALGAFDLSAADAVFAIALKTLTHVAVDAFKTFVLTGPRWREPRRDFAAFAGDQILHLSFITIAAWAFPSAFAQGEWSWRLGEDAEWLLIVYTLVAGFIAATRMGEFAIGKFLDRFDLGVLEVRSAAGARPDEGLPHGGAWIGLLERAAVFVLILIGQFAAIGFLLAAKSVLRFQYANERSHSEYVIIGTLTSFAWAGAVGLLTQEAIARIAA